MALVEQPTLNPTRKVWAMVISGAVVAIVQTLLNHYWPDHPFAEQLPDLDIWVQGGLMFLAAYMTREKE